MNTTNNILTELQEVAPAVANLKKHHFYSVPEGYFNNLSNEILAFVKQDELFSNAKHNPYITPNGYFTNLHEKIAETIKADLKRENEVFEELETVAPLLNALPKTNVYWVPDNYFEESKTEKAQPIPAKIVSFKAVRKWVNYAVAAVIMGIVGIGAIKYIGVKNTHFILKEVAKATDDEITSYLETQPHTDISNVSIINEEHGTTGLFEGTTTDEINQYLNEQPETAESFNKGI